MACTRPLRLAASFALAIAGSPAPAWAQAGVSHSGAVASGTALAQVVAPIAVTRQADLDFGRVTVSAASGGTVSLAPLTGSATYGGGVAGVCGSACTAPHPARFAVWGEPGRAYQVTLPARLTIPRPGAGGAAVAVDSLVAAAASSPMPGRGILSAQGRDQFEVGGTLHLPAAAPAAQYTTQVPVIVAYF